jgi:hypothetical protein
MDASSKGITLKTSCKIPITNEPQTTQTILILLKLVYKKIKIIFPSYNSCTAYIKSLKNIGMYLTKEIKEEIFTTRRKQTQEKQKVKFLLSELRT